MRQARSLAIIVLLLLTTHTAFAIKVDSIYRAELPVHSQSAPERARSLPQALAQVLIKASGSNQILDNSRVKARLNSADRLVQEFSYAAPQSFGDKTEYLLKIQFDPNGVNQLLRDASAPIWGQNRPLLLAWVALEQAPNPPIILGPDSKDAPPFMKQLAEQRGLPLIFPLMDVTDLNRVSVNDILSLTPTNLLSASKRYGSGTIIIGRVLQGPFELTTQWRLVMGNEQWDWTVSGKSLAEILPTIINNVANTLATRYAVVTTNNIQKNVQLKIIGINQHADFAKLIRYLNHLTPVAAVGISRILGNEVTLNVSLRSTQQSFTQALSLGKKLTPLASDPPSERLVFQWNP